MLRVEKSKFLGVVSFIGRSRVGVVGMGFLVFCRYCLFFYFVVTEFRVFFGVFYVFFGFLRVMVRVVELVWGRRVI